MYGGEGEPLLHKDIALLTQKTKESGIDAAFTTNGVLLDQKKCDNIIPYCEWIKISINAGTAPTYAKIHRTTATDFNKVVANLKLAVNYRDSIKSSCVIGMQVLLLPENQAEITTLAQIAADIGMDYLVIKPFSQHPASNSQKYKNILYNGIDSLCQDLKSYNTATFKVVLRANTIQKWNNKERGYKRCYALPFWSYIDSGGNVWGCSMYLNDERFLYGNITRSSFQEIWDGKRRQDSINWFENQFDIDLCRINCRMDKVNQYLWDLKNPPQHVNFI